MFNYDRETMFDFPVSLQKSRRGNSWWLKLKTFDIVGKKIIAIIRYSVAKARFFSQAAEYSWKII